MNWTTHEFIWLDWLVIILGVALISWMVYRTLHNEKKKEKKKPAVRISSGKVNLGGLSERQYSLPISDQNT